MLLQQGPASCIMPVVGCRLWCVRAHNLCYGAVAGSWGAHTYFVMACQLSSQGGSEQPQGQHNNGGVVVVAGLQGLVCRTVEGGSGEEKSVGKKGREGTGGERWVGREREERRDRNFRAKGAVG